MSKENIAYLLQQEKNLTVNDEGFRLKHQLLICCEYVALNDG